MTESPRRSCQPRYYNDHWAECVRVPYAYSAPSPADPAAGALSPPVSPCATGCLRGAARTPGVRHPAASDLGLLRRTTQGNTSFVYVCESMCYFVLSFHLRTGLKTAVAAVQYQLALVAHRVTVVRWQSCPTSLPRSRRQQCERGPQRHHPWVDRSPRISGCSSC